MVTVIGLGFVGLTTALGIAELGTPVFGYEIDSEKATRIKEQMAVISEPHLREQLRHKLGKRFFVTDDLQHAVRQSNCIILCVGTPCQDDGSVELEQVISAVKSCLDHIPDDKVHRTITIKSTVPPGTCKNVVEPLIRDRGFSDDLVSVASNPEFLREGCCWEDFMHPGRIVIGAENGDSVQSLRRLYEKLDTQLYIVSPSTAEYSKYLSNVMLATLISFSNEMAHVASVFQDVDVMEAFRCLHDDSRLKNSGIKSYLYPGCGYGGYCLPKDILAFTAALQDAGYCSELLQAVISINDAAAERICERVSQQVRETDTVGILGLAFKPETDDVRDSAAARIIRGLVSRGYNNLTAFDPLANEAFRRRYPDLPVRYCDTAKAVVESADAVIIATAWNSFRLLDYSNTILIDGRYMIEEKNK